MRDVAGHLIASTRQSPVVFFSGLAKAGFSFDKMVAGAAKRIGAADTTRPSPPRCVREPLRRNHPPGPVTAMLGEAVVHGEDIRRPLGLAASPRGDARHRRELLQGIQSHHRRQAAHRWPALKATDASWSSGDGPEVSGPLVSLVVAMTGRRQAYGDLSRRGCGGPRGRQHP